MNMLSQPMFPLENCITRNVRKSLAPSRTIFTQSLTIAGCTNKLESQLNLTLINLRRRKGKTRFIKAISAYLLLALGKSSQESIHPCLQLMRVIPSSLQSIQRFPLRQRDDVLEKRFEALNTSSTVPHFGRDRWWCRSVRNGGSSRVN